MISVLLRGIVFTDVTSRVLRIRVLYFAPDSIFVLVERPFAIALRFALTKGFRFSLRLYSTHFIPSFIRFPAQSSMRTYSVPDCVVSLLAITSKIGIRIAYEQRG